MSSTTGIRQHCNAVSNILTCAVILTRLSRVTDRNTDRITTAYTVLACKLPHGKNITRKPS